MTPAYFSLWLVKGVTSKHRSLESSKQVFAVALLICLTTYCYYVFQSSVRRLNCLNSIFCATRKMDSFCTHSTDGLILSYYWKILRAEGPTIGSEWQIYAMRVSLWSNCIPYFIGWYSLHKAAQFYISFSHQYDFFCNWHSLLVDLVSWQQNSTFWQQKMIVADKNKHYYVHDALCLELIIKATEKEKKNWTLGISICA